MTITHEENARSKVKSDQWNIANVEKIEYGEASYRNVKQLCQIVAVLQGMLKDRDETISDLQGELQESSEAVERYEDAITDELTSGE